MGRYNAQFRNPGSRSEDLNLVRDPRQMRSTETVGIAPVRLNVSANSGNGGCEQSRHGAPPTLSWLWDPRALIDDLDHGRLRRRVNKRIDGNLGYPLGIGLAEGRKSVRHRRISENPFAPRTMGRK